MIPVLKQNGFPSVPEVQMKDIGGMEQVKEQIYDNILVRLESSPFRVCLFHIILFFQLPLENKNLSDQLGVEDSSDILLWGPPGCGKTLLAKAVANQAGLNFLLISGAEVLKMVSLNYCLLILII